MALEQNDIRYDVDIDLQDSLREIDKLRQKLKTFSDDLAVDATKVQQRMSKAALDYVNYIRRLEQEMRTLKAQGRDVTAHEARLSQIRNRQQAASTGVARDNALGSREGLAARSVLQREINELRSNHKELIGKYFDELNGTFLRSVRRSMTDVQAEETLLRRRMEDRSRRAEVGDAAFGFQKQRERRRLNGGANQFMSQFDVLTNYAMVGGMYGAAYGLGGFVVNLEKEFKQFQAITASTNTEMGRMEDRLISVSEKTKFTALEVSEAATLMGQAGMSAGEVARAIEPVSMLATAAGTDLKSAVDVVTSALNIFNLQTNEAGHLADVFTAALNESKLTLDQLTLSLQYAGNTAATVGISYNELTAAIGSLANAGIRSGSTMGTGLRQLIVDLINPSKKLKAELDRLDLTMADINLETNGLTGVMSNLRTAGFDTAAAFEGLEVRAAAAFTALSNNLDTMNTLRQSFILSNAAADANEIQMESLANTALRFGSSLGTLVYKAFAPFLNTMQETLKVGADFLSWLNSFGPALGVVGTAFAMLTGAVVLSRLGALGVGLLGLATGAKTAAGAMVALRAATLGNPLFLGASALILGLQVFATYADKAGRVEAALDALKTKQNEYRASVDHTVDRVASLNAAMDDLIKKRQNLDAEGNEVLRKTKIMEVVATFSELGVTVDSSTASIGSLIEAMQDLKGEMVAGLPEQFALLVAQIDKQIAVLREASGEIARSEGYGKTVGAVSQRFSNGGAIYASEVPAFNDDVATRFGTTIGEAFMVMTNQLGVDEINGERAKGLQTSIELKLAELEKEFNSLSPRGGYLGTQGDLTDEEFGRLGDLKKDIRFLTQLSEAFNPLSKYLVETQALGLKRDAALREQVDATFKTTPGYIAAEGMRKQALEGLTTGLADITRADLPIKETGQKLKELETWLNQRIADINTQLDAGVEVMRQSGKFTEDQLKSALDGSELKSEMAKLQGAFKKGSAEGFKAVKEFQVYLHEQSQKTVNKQIEATKKQLADAQNERQVDLLENQLYELDTRLAKLEQEAFDLDEHKKVGSHAADLELASRKIRDEQKARRDSLIEGVIEKRAELAEKANQAYGDDLEAQLKLIQNEMKDLASSINNNSTPDYIRTIKQKLDEMNRKARELAGQIAGISVSDDFGAFSVGGLPTASAGEVQRKIIEAANKAGIPPQIALALASFESNFDPTAKNRASSAAGIYQNTDPNWASHGLKPGDRSSIDMQVYAGIQDMLRTQRALGTTQLSFRDYYGSHLLGQAGYEKARSRPNDNAVAVLGSDVVTNNGGNINQTTSQFLDQIVAKAAAHLEKVKDMVQRPMDAAGSALDTQISNLTEKSTDAVRDAGARAEKAQTKQAVRLLDESAKAIEAQINTLMVQSSKAQDPSAIQSIIDQVRTKWTDLMQKEVEAFTVANKDAPDFDERLKSLNEELTAGLNGKIVTLLDRYQAAIENQPNAPLLDAQAKLDAAQNPLYANKYTGSDIDGLQRNVQLKERAALVEKLNQLEQLNTFITQQIAAAEQQYGADSQMVQSLKERQFSVETSLGELRRQVTADTEAAARSELTLRDAIADANREWMIRNGLWNAGTDAPVSAAEQVGNAWSQVLDGIGNSMSQLFVDLAEGSMTAEEAFKKFGLSVVQMLMQMIAKAMVFNLIQNAMGNGSSSEGLGFLGLLFKGAGAATGTYISGVKRAAGGEYVTGSAPFRDSELRKVMPGEMILRASAVNQIGRDSLERVNALGNRQVAAGMPALPPAAPPDNRPINVWAVLPEERPQIGPDDVVAYISDDIRRRGVTRTLIKAINTGKL